jgi:hypothetical protein
MNLNMATIKMANYVLIALNVLVTSVNKASVVTRHPAIKLHCFPCFKEIIVLDKSAHLMSIVKADIVVPKIIYMNVN